MPCACAVAIASSTSRISAAASRSGSLPRFFSRSVNVGPVTYSNTMNETLPSWSASNTGTMFGCASRLTARASSSHCATDAASASGLMTLTATSRCSRGS